MRAKINFIELKPLHLVLLFGLLSSLTVSADEFKIVSFAKTNNDLSARKFEEKDDNGEPCALIKVRTDIQGLNFQSSIGIVKIVSKEGDYWVYVSQGEKRLKIFKNGFKTLEYAISNAVKSYDVFVLELSSDSKGWVPSGKGSLSMRSEPPGVSVMIDGIPDMLKTTPCSFENYKAASYRFFLTKKRFEPKDTVLSIEKDTEKQVIIKLQPKWGNLSINSNVAGTKYFLDKDYLGRDSLMLFGESDGVDVGKYSLEIVREFYHPQTQIIEVLPGDTTYVNIKLEPITGSLDIHSNPPGADVYIDNLYKGSTPYSDNEIIIGEHNIRIEKNKFLTEHKVITIEENENQRVDFSLRSYKKVRIESEPKNAMLTVNGEYIGKTPEEVMLPVGENSIKLEKDDHENLEKTIIVSEEKDNYSFSLELLKFKLNISSKPSNAEIFVNKIKVGNTPSVSYHENGRHRIKLAYESYYPRKKKIKIDNGSQNFNMVLKPMIKAIINLLYMPKTTDYTLPMYGFEVGWSYKNASRLTTSLGMIFNIGPENWENSVPMTFWFTTVPISQH
ncbi:MAG: PEGA domain-containing protein [Bacteroidales bacterium]